MYIFSVMIPAKYQLSYTEASRIAMNDLVGVGYNIRDVLNSGIILFKKASLEERGMALMESASRPKKDLQRALDVIFDTNIELLSDEDAALVKQLRQILGPISPEQIRRSAAAAHADVDAAESASKARKDKRDHRIA